MLSDPRGPDPLTSKINRIAIITINRIAIITVPNNITTPRIILLLLYLE